jgi:integrase
MTNHCTAPAAIPTSSTARPPTFGLGGLTAGDAERIAAAIDAELTESTRTSYASAWSQWDTRCRRRGVTGLPAVPEALAAYLAERAESGICFATLDGACSAIAHRHHQEGLPDPTAHVVVRRVRRGLRRIMGTAPRRQAHPLTVGELDRLVSSIDPLSAIGVRDRAFILLGYASALCPGELSALDLADNVAKPTGVLVAVRRSKTDQDGHGQLVGVARGEHRRTDPIRALAPGSRSAPQARVRSSPGSIDPNRHHRAHRASSGQQARAGTLHRGRLRRHPGHRPLAPRRPRHRRRRSPVDGDDDELWLDPGAHVPI